MQLGQGIWALPAVPAYADTVANVVELVGRHDGEVFTFNAFPGDDVTASRIRSLYDDARRAEWAEFESECGKCLAELQQEIANEKFTLAELDEEEQNVDRLRRWSRELRLRDVFDSVPARITQGHFDLCAAELDRFTALVYAAVGLSYDGRNRWQTGSWAATAGKFSVRFALEELGHGRHDGDERAMRQPALGRQLLLRRGAVAFVAVPYLRHVLAVLALVGGRRLADVHLFGEPAVYVSARVALVAWVRFDQLSLGTHSPRVPARSINITPDDAPCA
ncbi:MAG: chromate resistance protein ChrB [Acidimicrobiales bacterium]|nr:chromate resistance protein ChrB [Acidimicrobiales bacterium]